jgi:methionine-R-sulfoxide reductase
MKKIILVTLGIASGLVLLVAIAGFIRFNFTDGGDIVSEVKTGEIGEWGKDLEAESALQLSDKKEPAQFNAKSWESYVKPSEKELREVLSPLQFEVTQNEGTESPFNNVYDKNSAEGVYVDVVSGEPLYFSKDKYDSGTGWPSFVKPISAEAVVLREDTDFFVKRTEVRSRWGDSHLGHVFDDGPTDRGGKRYCMNSAALRFISRDKMENAGYAYLLPLMDN